MHPVFHVSQLKEKIGNRTILLPKLPILGNYEKLHIAPVAVLDRRLVKKKGAPVA